MTTANDLNKQGMKLYREERYEEAARAFADAQVAFAAEGKVKDTAESANNRGVCWRQVGHWEEAHNAFSEAREGFRSINDVAGEGQVVGNFGALLDSEGEPKQAAAYYEEAIKLLESTDEHDLAQATYSALSRLRLKQGNWVGAINAFESGLAQAERPNVVLRVVRKILGVPRKMIGGG